MNTQRVIVFELLIPYALKYLGKFGEDNFSFLQGILKGEIEMNQTNKERLAALLHVDVSLFEEEEKATEDGGEAAEGREKLFCSLFESFFEALGTDKEGKEKDDYDFQWGDGEKVDFGPPVGNEYW